MRNPKTIALILIAVLTTSGYLYTKHREKNQLAEAKILWQQTQQEAAAVGLELDFAKAIAKGITPGTSFIDDHPKIHELFNAALKDEIKYAELPYIEETETKTLTSFNKFLNLESKTPAETYTALLTYLDNNPGHQPLILQALHNSQNFGPKYLADNQGFFPARLVKQTADRLHLRTHCKIKLNQDPTQELKSTAHLLNLIDQGSSTLIQKTVHLAITLASYNSILTGVTSEDPSVDFLKNALAIMPPSAEFSSFFDSFQTEAGYAISYLDKFGKEKLNFSETQFLNAKVYITKFHIANSFKNGKPRTYNESTFADLAQDFTKSIPEAPFYAKDLVDTLNIGTEFYLTGEAKSRIAVDINRLLTACKIHQLTHGQYPKSLTEIPPKILQKLPTQPFNNNPYTYTPPTNPNNLPTITGQFKTTKETIKISSQDLLNPN